MGRTLDIVARDDYDPGITVATEYARGWAMVRPPGLLAQKIFWTFIDQAGAALPDDTWHEMPVAELNRTLGYKLGYRELEDAARQLLSVIYAFSRYDPETRGVEFDQGVLVSRVQARGTLNRKGGLDDQATIRWMAGPLLREIAGTSQFWTVVDRLVVRQLRSRYALSLYPYLAARFSLQHNARGHVTLSIENFRRLAGVEPDRHRRFRNLHVNVIRPAIEGITNATRYRVSYSFIKRGRAVSAVRLSWTPTRPSAQRELPLKAGDPFGQFPENGRIRNTAWELIVREEAPGKDPDFVGAEFASWCIRKKIPLADAGAKARFTTFCGGMDKPRASRGKPAPDSWETDAETHEISPYSEFPSSGRIRNTVFADLVAEHAPAGSHPDEVGRAYADQQRSLSPLLLSRPRHITHEADFTKFCQTWEPG